MFALGQIARRLRESPKGKENSGRLARALTHTKYRRGNPKFDLASKKKRRRKVRKYLM